MAQASSNPFLQSPYAQIGLDQPQAALPGQQAVDQVLPDAPAAPAPSVSVPPSASPSAAPRATPAATKPGDLLPPAELRPIFEASAREFNVPVNVLMALGQQESQYNANAIGQPTKYGRAKGMLQYLDDTAKKLGINPLDPGEAIPAAAKQLRERLDKGESMIDAVRGHFAGPDRAQWGPNTAAYGEEVLAKAGQIGDSLYGAPAPDTGAAPADAARAALQAQLDTEAPGRYRALTEVEAADLRAQQDKAVANQFSTALPREQYERMFRSMNKGATDAAIAQVMADYDKQAAARTQAGATKVEDRFATLRSPEAMFEQRLNAKLQAKSKGGVVPALPAAGTVAPKDLAIIDPGAADRETGFDAMANFLGKSTKAGLYDLAGAGARVLDEVAPFTLTPDQAATLYKDRPERLKELQDNSTIMVLSRFANRMAQNSDETMAQLSARAKRDYGNLEYATLDPEKAAYLSPTKVIGDTVRSLPSTLAMGLTVYLTRGAALQAERQALAAGLSQDMARQAAIQAGAKAMANVGAASEGAMGYGQQVNQVTQELAKMPQAELDKSPQYQALLAANYTPETARAQLIADAAQQAGRLAGIADAAVNKVGGEFLGKILTEGGKLIPRIMKGAANEALTETTQSALEQLGQNFAVQQNVNPNQALGQGVGEAAAAGAVMGGLMGGGAAGAGGTANTPSAEQQVADAITQQAERQQSDPRLIDAAARAALDPNQGAVAPVETRLPAPPSQAPGLLTRALEDAAAPQQPRVTATLPDGQQAAGQLTGYQEDADGNFVAQILGDDGQVHTVDSANGIQIVPDVVPASPLSGALDAAAEQTAAEAPSAAQTAPQIIPETMPAPEAVAPTAPMAEPIAVPERAPSLPEQLAAMDLPALQDRLQYIQDQAKRSGGMTRPMVDARNAVQREIKQRKQEAARAHVPTESTDERSAGAGMAAPAGLTESGQPSALQGVGQEPAPAAVAAGAEPGAGPVPAGASAAADAQPALTGYPTDLAARQARKDLGLGKSHQVIERAPGQFDLTPQAAKAPKQKAAKQEPTRKADKLAAADAKIARQEEAIAQAVEKAAQRHAATSWVIRDKETGKVIAETTDQKKVDALNTSKYEVVPALQHLQELNDPNSLARQAAEFTTAAPAKGAKNEERQQTLPTGPEETSTRQTDEASQGADVLTAETAANGERAALAGYAMSTPQNIRKKAERQAWERGWQIGKKKRDAMLDGKESVVVADRRAVPVLAGDNTVVWRDEMAGKDYGSPDEAREALERKVESDRKFNQSFEPAKPKQEPRRKKAKAEPVVMDEETYLATNGAGRQQIGEAALHRSSERKSEKTHRRQVEAQAQKDRELIVRRARLSEEYQAKVAAGEIRPPSAKEEVIARANGHPDLDSTQAARRIAERRGWEWRREDAEPAMSVEGDDIASAIDRLMTDQSGEATVNVPGLGEVTIPYGDAKAGLAHIAKRRGAAFLQRLPALLESGKVYTKGNQEGRVFLGNARDEAVISLTRDGKDSTWLLSAYERYPDLKEAKRSQVAEDRMPDGKYFTKDDLRSNLTKQGVLGQVIASMVDAGVIVLHGGVNKLPGAARRVKSVQAVTMPDGTIHMVASNLTPRTAMPVLLHEMFHQGGEKLIGGKEWGNLMGRLGSLYRQSEQSSGKAREFYDRARARVEAARRKGAVGRAMEVEEFAAYAIEEYEKDPRSLPAAIRKWVEDLLGLVKTWLVKNYGKQLGAVTPAQLSAMARWALMDVAVERRGEMFGRLGEVFSAGGESLPSKKEMVEILKKHPFTKLRIKPTRMFVAGSFAEGKQRTDSDIDVVVEVPPGVDANELQNEYRNRASAYFMKHNLRGVHDEVHPQWDGRRVDVYFVEDAEQAAEGRPIIDMDSQDSRFSARDAMLEDFQSIGSGFMIDGTSLMRNGQKIGDVKLEIEQGKSGPYLVVRDIRTTSKGQGVGTMALSAIMGKASEFDMPVALTTESMLGKAHQQRLRAYYERLGFVKNRGADKVPGITEEYVWSPPKGDGPRFSAGTDQTDTPAFKRWFGDSKVVDEDGAPLVVYHGTDKDFSTFSKTEGEPKWFKDMQGFYFTRQPEYASDYGGTVMPVYLAMNKPYIAPHDQYEHTYITPARRAELEAQGYDGMIFEGNGKQDSEYIVFKPEQIKSAIGNNGDFDPVSQDIRYSVTADDLASLTSEEAQAQGLTPAAQGKLRRFQSVIQDNMNRVKQVQERIGQITGDTELGRADYYGAETVRPGRIASRLDDFREGMFAPLIEQVAKDGYTPDQLAELLHAQHAEERNAAVARINPEHDPASDTYTGTQGSGMNDADAQRILAQYANEPKLLALANQARQIAKATLDLKLAYGLIKPADYELLTTQYQNYVPLKGDGEYGPKIKRATGHGERAEHILENIARDYEQATVAGEKNLARQSLLQLVLKYPDDQLWTARVPPRGKYVAGKSYSVQKNGKSEAVFGSLSQVNAFLEAKGAEAASYEVLDSAGERVVEFTKPLQDNEVIVYVNGDPVRLQFHDEALARQLRPLDGGQLNPILETMRKVNRYLSGIYTGYNPAFIFKNAVRDAITGTLNITANQGAGVAAKAWTNYPDALAAMGQWASTRQAPQRGMGRWLEEYRQHGGKTGASWMSDLEAQGKTIQATFDDARGLLSTAQSGSAKRAAGVAWRQSIGRLAHVIEVGNQATENALRLALYATLRQQGQSPAKAAQAAKSVTVDFDRKGSQTAALGALYLFLNPAIQGTANAMKAMAKGEHRLQGWALLGGLAAAGALAAGQGMDDDRDRWLGRSWEERTKAFRFKIGSHELVLPLSQEFAPFYAAGVAATEALRGEKTMTSAARLFSSFVDAYFPLQGAFNAESENRLADVAQAAVPTLVKPLVESGFNRNSFGSQIVPENPQTKDRADSQKMFRATKGTAYDTAAQTIAKLGEVAGQGKYENDWSKVSPETLKYLWRTYTGGLGAFITDSAGAARIAIADPNSLDTGDIPVLKDFVKEQNQKPLANRYRELAREAQAAITEYKQIKKAGDGEAADLFGENGHKLALAGMGKLIESVNKSAAALADRKVDINGDADLSLAEKRAALKAIDAEEAELYRGAIGAFTQ